MSFREPAWDAITEPLKRVLIKMQEGWRAKMAKREEVKTEDGEED